MLRCKKYLLETSISQAALGESWVLPQVCRLLFEDGDLGMKALRCFAEGHVRFLAELRGETRSPCFTPQHKPDKIVLSCREQMTQTLTQVPLSLRFFCL